METDRVSERRECFFFIQELDGLNSPGVAAWSPSDTRTFHKYEEFSHIQEKCHGTPGSSETTCSEFSDRSNIYATQSPVLNPVLSSVLSLLWALLLSPVLSHNRSCSEPVVSPALSLFWVLFPDPVLSPVLNPVVSPVVSPVLNPVLSPALWALFWALLWACYELCCELGWCLVCRVCCFQVGKQTKEALVLDFLGGAEQPAPSPSHHGVQGLFWNNLAASPSVGEVVLLQCCCKAFTSGWQGPW